MWTWFFPNRDLDCIRGTYPEGGNALSNRASDTIREPQPLPKYQGSMYKDIMANIGLDSPNTSSESTREEVRELNLIASNVDTPIRNNTSSLMALGRHDPNPRQKSA